ncbi:MAG: hypothetical protein FWC32_00555 [Firmicutes bacterium]|nr:hypothetical protein [Bacillota bacterium]
MSEITEKCKDFTPKDQFIAYIDILGYEMHMKKHGAGELAQALDKIIMGVASFPAFPTIDSKSRSKFKVFSDNILICSETNWYEVLLHVQYIQQYLLAAGIFSRGCMLYGELYFDDNFVCGQGIIDAHRLESEVAIFPRIIVDESFIVKMEPSIPDFYETALQAESSRQRMDFSQVKLKDNWVEIFELFKKDFDGMFFFNYMVLLEATDSTSQEEKESIFAERLIHHRNIIKQNLINNVNNKRILQKYQWCQNHHNEFCRQHGYHNLTIE